MDNIETLLKAYILKQYKSIREFSTVSNVPYSTIDSMLKRGVGNTSIGTAIKICNFLGLSVDALSDGKLEKKQSIPKEPAFQTQRLEYIISVTGKDDINELITQASTDITTFTHWLNGQDQPPQDKIELLASYLGVTSDYLMGLTNDPKGIVVKKEDSLSLEALKLATIFDGLNIEGQRKATEYVRDLSQMTKYQKKGITNANDVEVGEEPHPDINKKAI